MKDEGGRRVCMKAKRRMKQMGRRLTVAEGRLTRALRFEVSVFERMGEAEERLGKHDAQLAGLARRVTDVEIALSGAQGLATLASRLERVEERLTGHGHRRTEMDVPRSVVGRYCPECGQVTEGSVPGELHVCGLCGVVTLPVTSWPGLAVG